MCCCLCALPPGIACRLGERSINFNPVVVGEYVIVGHFGSKNTDRRRKKVNFGEIRTQTGLFNSLSRSTVDRQAELNNLVL